jgi:hypothetical protein
VSTSPSTNPFERPLDLSETKHLLDNPPSALTVVTVLITPEVAKLMLGYNRANRTLQPLRVEKYAGQMSRGRWTQIGNTISFSKSGRLLNGQHTLWAIIKSGQSYVYIVVLGLDDAAQEDMDQVTKRSLAQALTLRGEKDSTLLGGAVRMIWQIQNGGTPGKWLVEPSNPEFCDFVDDQIRDSVKIAHKVSRGLKLPGSPVAAAHYVCAQVDQNGADVFFEDLGDTRAVIAEDSAINAMRGTARSWVARGSVSRSEQASLYDVLVRAFDAHRAGKTFKGQFRMTRRPKTFRRPSSKVNANASSAA